MTRTVTLASLLIAGYAAWYILACALVPFGRCPCTRTPAGNRRRRDRLCRRCDGTGRRVRLGRRIYNHVRRLHRDGTR